jgi:hypothetical protein
MKRKGSGARCVLFAGLRVGGAPARGPGDRQQAQEAILTAHPLRLGCRDGSRRRRWQTAGSGTNEAGKRHALYAQSRARAHVEMVMEI